MYMYNSNQGLLCQNALERRSDTFFDHPQNYLANLKKLEVDQN